MKTLTPPLKWHGGKHYLAKRIIEAMPPRCANPNAPAADDRGWLHYVEPFFGGGAVLLANDPEGISEVANDLNGDLSNFWSVLGSQHLFGKLKLILETVPFSEPEFEAANEALKGEMDRTNRAAAFFIAARQSRQGLMKDFATMTRNRTRRGMNEQVSSWLGAIEGLADVHARLRRVVVTNKCGIKLIAQQDGPRSFFYLDPPYKHDQRVTTSDYAHEMDDDGHQKLLDRLGGIQGRFILSGYPSEQYEFASKLYGWHRIDIAIDNKASSKATKEIKTECLWMNYAPLFNGASP